MRISLPLTFGVDGESNEVFTDGTTRVFVRTPDGVQFTVLTQESGEPLNGQTYDTFLDRSDVIEFLSRRGFHVEE